MLTLEGLRIEQGGFSLSADLSVPTGRFVALLGPSGAGKSTLLGAIAGFVAHEGRVIWDGAVLDGLAPGDRPVAMLFQDNNLFPHLDVARNVALALTTRTRIGDEDRRRVEDALARVGLAGFGPRKPGTLSGGQQSRVALARALLQDRPLVLLDEPFSALGPGQRGEMMQLCREVLGGAGRTVLFVTHDPQDAARADDICTVIDGRVAPPVPAADLLADPPEAIRSYLGK